MTAQKSKISWLGNFAVAFGSLALVLAILPTYLLPLLSPPESADKVVIDFARKIKDRAIATVKGVQYQEPQAKRDWYQILAAAAMVFGVLAIIFAAGSFIAKESWRYAVVGSALGIGAVMVQFSLLVAGILVVIVLVAVILNFLGLNILS
jgi:hypothetical protein